RRVGALDLASARSGTQAGLCSEGAARGIRPERSLAAAVLSEESIFPISPSLGVIDSPGPVLAAPKPRRPPTALHRSSPGAPFRTNGGRGTHLRHRDRGRQRRFLLAAAGLA